jgi:hypothetical protein
MRRAPGQAYGEGPRPADDGADGFDGDRATSDGSAAAERQENNLGIGRPS